MRDKSGEDRWAGWAKLLLGLAGVWFFVFLFVPWFSRLDFARPLLDFVRQEDIDAAALFYTDIEEFSEAEVAVRSALKR